MCNGTERFEQFWWRSPKKHFCEIILKSVRQFWRRNCLKQKLTIHRLTDARTDDGQRLIEYLTLSTPCSGELKSMEYHNNPKYWDRQTFANSVEPDQMLQNVASNQVLPCLPYIQQYLTLVLLNPDIPCLCKQCRSRSVQKPTDLDLHCLSFSMWIYISNLD